ncbi:hypothetical protein D3C74_204830 [compost metagenome]
MRLLINPFVEFALQPVRQFFQIDARRQNTVVWRNGSAIILTFLAARYRQPFLDLVFFILVLPQQSFRTLGPQGGPFIAVLIVDPAHRGFRTRVALRNRERPVSGHARMLAVHRRTGNFAGHRRHQRMFVVWLPAKREVRMIITKQGNLVVFTLCFLLVVGLRERLMVQQLILPQAVHKGQITLISFLLRRIVDFAVLVGVDDRVIHSPESEEEHSQIVQLDGGKRNFVGFAVAIRVFFLNALQVRVQLFRRLRLLRVQRLQELTVIPHRAAVPYRRGIDERQGINMSVRSRDILAYIWILIEDLLQVRRVVVNQILQRNQNSLAAVGDLLRWSNVCCVQHVRQVAAGEDQVFLRTEAIDRRGLKLYFDPRQLLHLLNDGHRVPVRHSRVGSEHRQRKRLIDNRKAIFLYASGILGIGSVRARVRLASRIACRVAARRIAG